MKLPYSRKKLVGTIFHKVSYDSQQTQYEQSKLRTGRHDYGRINVPTRTALAINAV